MDWIFLHNIFSNVKDLLLQLLIVLFPVFILQVYWMKESSVQDRSSQTRIVGLVCSLGILLCLMFPVNPHDHFELSAIPLVTSILYGGYLAGGFSYFFLIVFKLFFNEGIVWMMLFNDTIVLLVSILFVRKYKSANRILKLSFFTTLICISSVVSIVSNFYLVTVHSQNGIDTERFVIYLIYPLVSMMAIWIVIHMVENVREKHLMELEVQKAERLNIMGHLAASVAHEIRNPMTVVRGFMQIFNKESFVPEDKKVFLKLMIQELDRAEGIINDYLTLAKPRLGKQERINVAEQIQSVIEIISSFAMLNNINVDYLGKEDGMYVLGIPQKLNQVLINLIKNAIEASPKGETVTINAYRKDRKIWIEIKDRGIGLSKEEIKRIGMPFYTTKNNGTGLGLMVCFQIIKAMNGKIEVLSQKNKGTLFIIKLPECLE